MTKAHLIAFLFFLPLAIFSQETTVLKGQILADSLGGSAINIVNLSSKTGTTNDSSGNFKIEVKLSDTLFFSSVQYDIKEVIISKELLEKAFLEVYLIERINELEEVAISNIKLSGNLGNDLESISVFGQESVGFELSTKPKPTSIQRKMTTASGSPLMYLINTLNGRLKMLKKAQEIMDYENWIDVGLDILPAEFFIDDLRIPKGKSRQFVYFCAEDPSFVALLKGENALGILEFYLEKAPLFIATHEKQDR